MHVPLPQWSKIVDGTNMTGTLVWPSDHVSPIIEIGDPMANGWRSVTALYDIKPQPDWERMDFLFTVPANEYLFIDNVKMATQCVPEPGTLLLISSGLIGFVGFRKKITKS